MIAPMVARLVRDPFDRALSNYGNVTIVAKDAKSPYVEGPKEAWHW
jgi:hypothetical protein